jgi:Skp family chaperone for outer membrane proteins
MFDMKALRRGMAAAVLLALFGLAATGAARAQEASTPSLAIIDVQQVFRESAAIKDLNQKLEVQRTKYRDELRKEEEALRAADQELARQRTVLSADAFAKKRGELERKVAKLQREAQQRKRKLDQFFNQGMAQIRQELNKIATEIAEERGLDMILTKATVVVVRPKFELTGEALKRLNERLPEISVPGL